MEPSAELCPPKAGVLPQWGSAWGEGQPVICCPFAGRTDLAAAKVSVFTWKTMALKAKMAVEGKGNPYDIEDEQLDKTNPFSTDAESSNPFSEESETTNPFEENETTNPFFEDSETINPFEESETTNPFEGGSDEMADDNLNHLEFGSGATPPKIEIERAAAGDNCSSSNPFDSSVDAEDKYGNCYKDIDNPVEQPDESEAEPIEFDGEAESIQLKVENRDDMFGKDFTMTQMKKRRSTIRRIGSLRKTPSMKAFRCPKGFCGFFARSADGLAIHVDRFHGAYHDLLSPKSPELSKKRIKKHSPVYGAKRLSDIMWGTMTAGKTVKIIQ